MQIITNIVLENNEKKPVLIDVFYKETNQKKPIVIFCHGYKGFKDWGAWNLMGKKFSKEDFVFIKFNFSYNGGTVENPLDFPDLEAFGNNNYTKELDDLKRVIDWCFTKNDFNKEMNLENISIIGHSRGGGVVCIKAEEDIRVKKVISLAGVSDFKKRSSTTGELKEWKEKGVKFVLNSRTKQSMPHFYQFYEDFIKNEKRLTIRRAVENLKKPYCIIHGDADTSIFIKEAEDLNKWNVNSDLKIIKGANHVFGAKHPWKEEKMPSDLEKATQLCINFLKKQENIL